MAVTASDIMDRAQRIVLDETNVRWPLPELLLWINDAERDVVIHKPSALSVTEAMTLQEGTYQKVPEKHIGLLRVVRNLVSAPTAVPRLGGRAVRVVSREILDTQNPDWHDPNEVEFRQAVKHYLFDEQDPRSFYVYPGNDGSGVLECIFAAQPQKLVLPQGVDASELASYSMPLNLSDIYANAVLDFVLYRAYTKDAQFAGNAQRAAAHYQQYANGIGIKVQNDLAVSPNAAAQQRAS